MEHDYARPGDWAIHYFTDLKGKYAAASMIRYFDDGRILRMTMDATHFHLDTTGDWKKPGSAPKDAAGHPIVTIASDESPDDDSLKYEGRIINEGGDKWLRISQSFDEPGGLEDGLRNAKSLR